MALCVFDNDYIKDGYTMLDNAFIQHYMPYCDAVELKVYIYGLALCGNPYNGGNSVERLCEELNLTAEQVTEAFQYWEQKGIVKLLSKNPLSVKYLSVKNRFSAGKFFKKEKYTDFNTQLIELFPGRMITPNEYQEYYNIIEDNKMEPDAMLLIIKYCLNYCSKDNPVKYIKKVADSWIADGVLTVAAVEERLVKEEAASAEIRAVLHTLGKSGSPEPIDRQLYIKWINVLGFTGDAILAAAKAFKKKGNMNRLDSALEEYLKMGVYTAEDILGEAKRRDSMYDIAIRVNKALGLYYESLDSVLEVYISPWLQKGYDDITLVVIAEQCFKENIRTLDGMNRAVSEYFEAGYISLDSVRACIKEKKRLDENIENIIKLTGSNRKVTLSDRELYNNWTVRWGFNEDSIAAAAAMAAGRPYAISYINQILGKWKQEGKSNDITAEVSAAKVSIIPSYNENEWSAEEMRDKLMADKTYNALEKARRKLSIEIAKVISGGGIEDVEMRTKYDELQKRLEDRAAELGYKF